VGAPVTVLIPLSNRVERRCRDELLVGEEAGPLEPHHGIAPGARHRRGIVQLHRSSVLTIFSKKDQAIAVCEGRADVSLALDISQPI